MDDWKTLLMIFAMVLSVFLCIGLILASFYWALTIHPAFWFLTLFLLTILVTFGVYMEMV